MGGTTPNFGLRFPYQGEVVTPAHFKNLADDMDAAIATLNALKTNAYKHPVVQVYGSGGTAGAQGATTTMNLGAGASVPWNISGMWSTAQPDRLTCKVAGIYQVRLSTTGGNSSGVTALNAFELKLNFLGSKPKLFQHKSNTEQTSTTPPPWQVNAIWPMAVNDYVQPQFFWSGTGTSITPFPVLEARLVAYT